SGYCGTGRLKLAMTPAIVMMIASTVAKIGRSMKKREKLPMGLARGGLGGGGRRRGRCRGHFAPLDRSPGTNLHEVVDDHEVALREPGGHDGVGADPARGLHRLGNGLA